MRRVINIFLVIIGLYACSPQGVKETPATKENSTAENIGLSDNLFHIVGDLQPFNTEIKIDTLDENVYLINLSLYTDFPSYLPQFQFEFKYPQKLINSLWSSRTWTNESFINFPNYSRLQSDYNIVSGLNAKSQNRITLTTFDDFQSRFTQIDIKTMPDTLVFAFNFFNRVAPDAELLEYKAQMLVDLSEKQYSECIRSAAQWRLDKEGNKSITKVDLSLQPVYSLWYPMDKNVPLENITHYFDSISAMGFRSVLFDDGWQNVVRFEVDEDGKWDPSKIDVVKDFMDKVRESDMKVALWYSQPFVGSHTYIFNRFDGKYLQYRTSSQPILDIRYPEVRQYLAEMYNSVISEWGIDGVWFNFINGYYPDEQIIITDDLGRDFVSVRKAADSLSTYLESELLYKNPELSINHSYNTVGPLHTSNAKTINGFLGTTALAQVREKLVNNRLLYGDYSPFMEVMGIHPKDAPVNIAKKFHNIMFGTPYISYFSYTLPEEVRETLSFWIRYWKTNNEYLMQSSFKAYAPVQRYSSIIAGNQIKQILVFYDRVEPFDLGYFDFEQVDVINSSDYGFVSVKGTPTGKVDYITYDHKGAYIERGSLKFKQNVATLEVPEGGFARLIVK